MSGGKFPARFFWGAATAAHQVEGNNHNNWSVWELEHAQKLAKQAPGFYKSRVPNWSRFQSRAQDPNNYISGLAADHYNRYEQDIEHLKNLGLNAYRFSIEWSRIEPKEGEFNQAAIDHYQNVIKALRSRGIEPFVTLHHFTDPLWLTQKNGWLSHDFPKYFSRYAQYVVEKLGQHVKYWITINESESYLLGRYMRPQASPTWPWPDWPNAEKSLRKYAAAKKNLIKAHRTAYVAIKKTDASAQVGFSHAMVCFEFSNWLAKPIVSFLDWTGGSGFLNKVNKFQDFIGVNYYSRIMVKMRGFNPQQFFITNPKATRISDFGLEVYPEGLYKVTQLVKRFNKPIYITENGIADHSDEMRADFITDHLKWLHKSIEDGADIRGYFYWSLLDNFEWSAGFWPQFGLFAVEPKTGNRKVRASAQVYAKIARANAIDIV